MMKERRRRGENKSNWKKRLEKGCGKSYGMRMKLKEPQKKTPTNLWLCTFLVSRRVGRSALRVCVRRCLEPNSISFSPLQPWSVDLPCHPYNCTFHSRTPHKQSGDVPELPDTTLGDTQIPDAGLVCTPIPHMHTHTYCDLLCSAQTSTTTTATRTRSTTTRPTVRARPRSPTTTQRPHHTAPPLRPPRTPQQQGQQRRACPGSC